ncbi:EDD domain protein, DegV family [Marvinbryantia formatexigens DSM 14469]|uniref:EDD domain protein, DegV family n=1 Tax=Marvinbryantia formatexigens DSM 14469 TaxID=478749 RepID=C6LBR8_9FIRM|nr:DegV family protein [Marvinbryantia formatexigens]EET61871.1 EDD domain protein, DegV family [Marvinbryantia formatexigens DSM 14469]UWO25775.1 DegV family protein [Marvinbryantia formatexigens DSM 14469]SDF36646.1 EDD domain protein, DegV family [Marvinbryantia formatexigens]
MNVAIVTDSNSGIFEEEGQKLGVQVVPMPVVIDGKVYYEGADLTSEEFYQCLLEHREVSSSQPSPGDVTAVWDRLLDSGYDEIVYIPMSGGLSGSCQMARMLAEDYKGKVQVADNRRISVTQRQSVQDALMLREKGHSAREIKEILEKYAYESIIYVGVETLEYLKKGGRVTPAGAAMGTLLNIKPLLLIKGERLDACAKVRGTRNCQKRLLAEMKRSAEELRKKGTGIYIGAAGSFVGEEQREWVKMVRESFPGEEVRYDPLTCSIGCHVGPGAFGMGISRKTG